VESGLRHSQEVVDVVGKATRELVSSCGCDTIILGCTHFPIIKDVFELAAGPEVTVVDSAHTTAAALGQTLKENQLRAPEGGQVQHELLVTAHAESFERQAQVLFGEHVRASMATLRDTVAV
jgi:glutamate racemase